MARLARPVQARCWFVVLPDCQSATEVASALRVQAQNEVAHPSGRPWLLGSWPEDAVAIGEAGQVKIAVIGQHAITPDDLRTVAGRTRALADLDRFTRSLVGSAHVVASIPGRVRVQGSVTGLRSVFHARVGAVTIAADRADVLADLLGAPVDDQRIAARLLDAFVYPLTGEAVWRGVNALAPDRYLVLDGDGRHWSVKCWSPPDPVVPIGAGAETLREALRRAVDARVRGRTLVSSDLGGLDSTSVCCLAARQGVDVIAYTGDGRDPMADDVKWARRTVRAFDNVEHRVIAGDLLPPLYDGLLDMDERLDEPWAAAVTSRRYLCISEFAAGLGSRLHLTGFGGDELLAGSPAHLHHLLRRHPIIAMRHTRGFSVQRAWANRETVRQLLDSRPYRSWLASAAGHLTDPTPSPNTPSMEWGRPPRLPPWATPDSVDAVRELLRAAARTAEPLSDRRGQHVELEAMRANSRMVRQLDEMAQHLGVALAAPYFDDRVVEAGLAVRPQDKVTPWRYKPLIGQAMRGVVPEETLSRHTKDEGSYEVETGLQERRGQLLGLCDDSRLGDLGLIDPGRLREVCTQPPLPGLPFDALFQTAACEVWLRTVEQTTVPT
ncbi:MAG TPA: lasso peptide isopeptide bond-forming cyclase [Acidimicrobiales bacterium]|nr:lasso peptide isopeptide bond-forming cyclase [Acidimicrobiales bacterium]